MRVLIANDGRNAMYHIRLGIANALADCGHEVIMWDLGQKPTYDAFDEFSPELFIGQTYNLTDSIIQCIRERPNMKVIMKAGDWGIQQESINLEEYPVLVASEEEKQRVTELYHSCGRPNYIYVHYHPDRIENSHGGWEIPAYSQMNAADIFRFTNGKKKGHFLSDICFLGGYWPYKARCINEYLLPLCYQDKYNIKIYGNLEWPVYQYCGTLVGDNGKHALASATVCPNVSEPHSQKFGFDIIERPFKLLSNKCFMVSDYVEDMEKVFGDSVIMAKSPEEFKEKIEYYIEHPKERDDYINRGYETVINGHTYHHRVIDMMNQLGLPKEAEKCKNTLENTKEKLKL